MSKSEMVYSSTAGSRQVTTAVALHKTMRYSMETSEMES